MRNLVLVAWAYVSGMMVSCVPQDTPVGDSSAGRTKKSVGPSAPARNTQTSAAQEPNDSLTAAGADGERVVVPSAPVVEPPKPSPRPTPVATPAPVAPPQPVIPETAGGPAPSPTVPAVSERPNIPNQPSPTNGPAPNAGPNEVCKVPTSDPKAHVYVQVVPFANMEHGFHILEEGSIFQLVRDGRVAIAGYATMEAAMYGQAIEGRGAYPGLLLRLEATYVSDLAESSGQIFLCRGPIGVAPQDAKCMSEQQVTSEDRNRPTSVLGQKVSWKVRPSLGLASEQTSIPQVEVQGGKFNVSAYHPVFAAAAPGKAFNDFQSPLVFDLNADRKFDLIDIDDTTKTVLFDVKGDGHKSRMGWVRPVDGLLALDIDGNGRIDSGRELFGEHSARITPGFTVFQTFANGFDALAQYDANGDHVIDAKDPVYSRLVLWQDQNSNGISDPWETSPLAAHHIASISLHYFESPKIDAAFVANNEVRLLGSFKTMDGRVYTVADIWFRERQSNADCFAAAMMPHEP